MYIAIPIVMIDVIVPVIVFIINLNIPSSPNSLIIATCKINNDITEATKFIDLDAAIIGE